MSRPFPPTSPEGADRADLRVLFVTRKWPPAVGGMELYSRELAHHLSDLVDLHVIALPGRTDGTPPDPFTLVRFLIATAFQLARMARTYDVVHFGDMVLFPLARWVRLLTRRPRLFVTVHGLDLVFGRRPGWKAALYRLFLAWARRARCVDHFIANSRHTARLAHEEGFAPATAVLLGASVSDGAEPQASEDRYILFVGRLVARKGARWFAEHVLPRLPEDVELRVVGKPWDREEAAALARAPRVRMLGYVGDDELMALRAGARAQIMPNVPSPDGADVEGFGIAAVEAAASGAPLLAADLEGLSDAVRDGETGYLLPPGDAAAWAARIMDVLAWDEDTRRAFAAMARAAVLRHYTWHRVAEQTLAIYRDTPKTRS